jgi:hypothetical protein
MHNYFTLASGVVKVAFGAFFTAITAEIRLTVAFTAFSIANLGPAGIHVQTIALLTYFVVSLGKVSIIALIASQAREAWLAGALSCSEVANLRGGPLSAAITSFKIDIKKS